MLLPVRRLGNFPLRSRRTFSSNDELIHSKFLKILLPFESLQFRYYPDPKVGHVEFDAGRVTKVQNEILAGKIFGIMR